MQSIKLKFVDKSFRENHAIYLCFRESKGNKREDIADLCKEVSLETTKMDLFDACGVSVQDCTELKVTECLKFDKT